MKLRHEFTLCSMKPRYESALSSQIATLSRERFEAFYAVLLQSL